MEKFFYKFGRKDTTICIKKQSFFFHKKQKRFDLCTDWWQNEIWMMIMNRATSLGEHLRWAEAATRRPANCLSFSMQWKHARETRKRVCSCMLSIGLRDGCWLIMQVEAGSNFPFFPIFSHSPPLSSPFLAHLPDEKLLLLKLLSGPFMTLPTQATERVRSVAEVEKPAPSEVSWPSPVQASLWSWPQ